jgi:hypothetical protein
MAALHEISDSAPDDPANRSMLALLQGKDGISIDKAISLAYDVF